MSHDETSGPVTRKERRKAYGGKRRKITPRPFKAFDYVRQDWSGVHLVEMLESRAHGYNGMLRALLCTSAAMLGEQNAQIMGLEDGIRVRNDAVSKRSQQPGRLSGGEREALKKLVAMVAEVGSTKTEEEVTAAGRALLTKVRKRALEGDQEALAVEELDDKTLAAIATTEVVDASALMPVGVEELDPEAKEVAARITMAAGDPL